MYQTLVEYVGKQGFSEEESRHAIRRCMLAASRNGALSYLGPGAAIAYFVGGPGVPIAVGLIGATATVAASASCGDVRQAIQRWGSEKLDEWNFE